MKRILLAAAIACSLLASCSSQPQDAEPYSTYRAKHISTGAIMPVIVLKALDIYKAGDTVEVNSSWVIRNYMNSRRDTTVRVVVLQAKHQPIELAAN